MFDIQKKLNREENQGSLSRIGEWELNTERKVVLARAKKKTYLRGAFSEHLSALQKLTYSSIRTLYFRACANLNYVHNKCIIYIANTDTIYDKSNDSRNFTYNHFENIYVYLYFNRDIFFKWILQMCKNKYLLQFVSFLIIIFVDVAPYRSMGRCYPTWPIYVKILGPLSTHFSFLVQDRKKAIKRFLYSPLRWSRTWRELIMAAWEQRWTYWV